MNQNQNKTQQLFKNIFFEFDEITLFKISTVQYICSVKLLQSKHEMHPKIVSFNTHLQ